MTSKHFLSIGAGKSQLRDRIIRTYQRAQRLIDVAASPTANGHIAIIAYDRACERLRMDIARVNRLFPDADGLVNWLLEDLPQELASERDRKRFVLIIESMKDETEETQTVPQLVK